LGLPPLPVACRTGQSVNRTGSREVSGNALHVYSELPPTSLICEATAIPTASPSPLMRNLVGDVDPLG